MHEDHVFDETCSNNRVYDLLTKDIIHATIQGFNGNLLLFCFLIFFRSTMRLLFWPFNDDSVEKFELDSDKEYCLLVPQWRRF